MRKARSRKAGRRKREPRTITMVRGQQDLDPRALADAVFARTDPEQLAVDLLQSNDKRLQVQVLSLLLAYKFGKPAQRVEATGPGGGPVRVVWDIPRPARETQGLEAT